MSYTTFKEYMQQTGKSDRQVARLIGVSQSHINMIKNGYRRPSPEVARKMEALSGIPFRDLLLSGGERRAERAQPKQTCVAERAS